MFVASVIDASIVDGPGLRTVVFTQGCRHACKGCYNPDTWEFGKGTHYTPGELLAYLNENCPTRLVTFSGGDPVYQEDLEEVCRLLKENGYHIIVYTGFLWEEICTRPFLRYVDALVDGPFEEDLKTLDIPFVGSANQRKIDVQGSLEAGELCPAGF